MNFKRRKQVHSWPLGTVNGHGHGHVWLAVPTSSSLPLSVKEKWSLFVAGQNPTEKKIRGRCFSCREENPISKGVSNILFIFYQHQGRFNLNERFCSLILFQQCVKDQF